MTTQSLSFKAPPSLAVAIGATSPDPGKNGAQVWSTTALKVLEWRNGSWVDPAASGSGWDGILPKATAAPTEEARVVYRTDTDVVQVGTGTQTRTLVDTLTAQNLNSKTFVGCEIAVGYPLDYPALSGTPTPRAGYTRLFSRTVGGRNMMAMVGPSGLDTSLQPLIARNKVGWSVSAGNGTTVSNTGIAFTTAGTATAANVAATNLHTAMRRIDYLVTTAATTAVAGIRGSANMFFRGSAGGKLGGWHLVIRGGPATGQAANATRRAFFGMHPTAAHSNVNPSSLANIIGVGCDNADTTYQFMHRTGTGTVVKFDTGILKSTTADRTKMFELAMFAPPGGSYVDMEFTDLDTGTVATYRAETALPAETTLLAPDIYYGVGATSSVIGVSMVSIYIETDY